MAESGHMFDITSMSDDESEAGDGRPRRTSMKQHQHQYLCRGLVCAAALIVVLVGAGLIIVGAYSSFAESPAQWMPGVLGTAGRAAAISNGGFVSGIVMALFGCFGLLGAFRRSKPCLCLFGLASCVLLTAVAAMIAIIWQAHWAIGAWRDAGFRLAGDLLSDKAMVTLRALHGDVAALYAFCDPAPAGASAIVADFDAGSSLPSATLSFNCTEPSLASFESCARRPRATMNLPSRAIELLAPRLAPKGIFLSTAASHIACAAAANAAAAADAAAAAAVACVVAGVQRNCLAHHSYDGVRGEERLAQIAACRADAANLGSSFAHDALGARSTWLFCACSSPLAQTISDRWYVAVMIIANGLMVYLALLVCVTWQACKGAAKAKKRRKAAKVMEVCSAGSNRRHIQVPIQVPWIPPLLLTCAAKY